MTSNFWKIEDFDVFSLDGLENRMTALQEKIQPKFHQLGNHFATRLSAHGTDEFFPHVAKHARRTVNPPKDSWVALAPAKRGYKALPHFQIGLWGSHLFIVIAVIYENPDKKGISERLLSKRQALKQLPTDFILSGDHMKPDATPLCEMNNHDIENLLYRLQNVKKAEFLVGRHLSRDKASAMSTKQFMKYAEDTFDKLLPIYDVIIGRQ